jgi:hypothetical protein
MPKCLDSVNRHDGNVVPIFSEQFRIRFDVDLCKDKLILTTGGMDRLLRFVA